MYAAILKLVMMNIHIQSSPIDQTFKKHFKSLMNWMSKISINEVEQIIILPKHCTGFEEAFTLGLSLSRLGGWLWQDPSWTHRSTITPSRGSHHHNRKDLPNRSLINKLAAFLAQKGVSRPCSKERCICSYTSYSVYFKSFTNLILICPKAL